MLITVPLLLCVASCYAQITSKVKTLEPGTPSQLETSIRNGLTEKIGNFSIEFLYYMSVLQAPGQNIIISPITIWTALAVMSEGATGNTRNQINNALRLTRNKNVTRMMFGEIAQWFQIKSNTVELEEFNGIFVDKLRLPIADFQETAKTSYNTAIVALSFNNSELAANLLNGVISNFTHGRIKNIVESSSFQNTPMMLASAVYFKGQWAVPFNTTSTSKQPFYDSNGTQIGEVNMMYNRVTYPFSKLKTLQARVIELPYGKEDRLSMLIMLPNHGVSLENMFFNFQKVSLDFLFEELRLSKEEYPDDVVDCFIPRFKIKSDLDLTEVLKQQFSIRDLFDMNKAKLPHMARTPLYVSKLTHKAEIEVTEDGTVASAVTLAELGDRIGVIRFEVNQPFTYMIVEKITNTIIIEGFYRQPSLY